MAKILKHVAAFIFLYGCLTFLTPYNTLLLQRSIDNQIAYLNSLFLAGYDVQLQQRYPEGLVFSNAIFALAVLEYAEVYGLKKPEYAHMVDQRIQRLLSHASKKTFDDKMTPPYGAFYNGWLNVVLKKYRESPLFVYTQWPERIKGESEEINRRLNNAQHQGFRILDTYSGLNWPADNLVCLWSMNRDSTSRIWLDAILQKTAHPSGLINHEGSDQHMIRGSSQALITYCLGKMKYGGIKDYNERYRKLLIDDFCGVQWVRENEDGSDFGDIDSGPVILGYGASATIMNIKTQASLGAPQARKTWALFNTMALPVSGFGRKFYLFKREPMFDIFMLWSSVEL